jgi:hypothetical protein
VCSDGVCIPTLDEDVGEGARLAGTANLAPGVVSAHRVELGCRSTVLKLGGFFVSASTARAEIGLYRDDNGMPGEIVTFGGGQPESGRTEFSPHLSNMLLAPGYYWIAISVNDFIGVYRDDNGNGVYANGSVGSLGSTFPRSNLRASTERNSAFMVVRRNPL